MDSAARSAERRWKEQPRDTAAARAYVKHLAQKGEDGLNALADLLSDRPFDLPTPIASTDGSARPANGSLPSSSRCPRFRASIAGTA